MTEKWREYTEEQFQEDERRFQLVVQTCGQAVEILETGDRERLVTLLLWQSPFDLLRSTLNSFTAGNASGKVRRLKMSYTDAKAKSTTVNEMKRAWSQVLFHFEFSGTIRTRYAQLIKRLETLQEAGRIYYLYDFARAMTEFADPETTEKGVRRVGLDQAAEIITTSKTPLISAFGRISEYLREIAGDFGFNLKEPRASQGAQV